MTSRELEALPRLLRLVAYTQEYLPLCCDLLWKLGRDDDRDLGPNPDHAIRVLKDIAEYDLDKPLGVNASVVDAVEGWLAEPHVHEHTHSVLDVLDPLLDKVSSSNYADGPRYVIRPFHVDPDKTALIRERAMNLIVGCLTEASDALTLRVLDSLFRVLQEPMALYGLEVTLDDVEGWQEERRRALREIKNVVSDTDDALVHLQVAEKLSWYTNRERHSDLASDAKAIIDAIPRTLEVGLLALLSHRFDLWPGSDGSYHPSEYEDLKRRNDEATRSIVDQVLRELQGGRLIDAVEEALRRLTGARIHVVSYGLYEELAAQGIDTLFEIAEWAVEHPDSMLTPHLGQMLFHLWKADRDKTLSIASRGLDRGHVIASRAVSSWSAICASDPQPQDVALIHRLIDHPDRNVRVLAVEQLSYLGRQHPQVGLDLIRQVAVGTDQNVAQALCQALVEIHTSDPSAMLDSDIESFLVALRPIPEIDDHFILRYLKIASQRALLLMVEMLLSRVLDYIKYPTVDFQPLPHFDLPHVFKGAAHQQEYGQVIRAIRQAALGDDWQIEFWIPKLFVAASDGCSSQSLELIREWITSEDSREVRASARLLREMPPDFVFVQTDLVVELLEHAFRLDQETYDEVIRDLGVSVRSRIRSRAPAVEDAFPEDIAQERGATNTMNLLTPGTPAYRFYEDLKRDADARIVWQRQSDEEDFG